MEMDNKEILYAHINKLKYFQIPEPTNATKLKQDEFDRFQTMNIMFSRLVSSSLGLSCFLIYLTSSTLNSNLAEEGLFFTPWAFYLVNFCPRFSR